MFTQPALFVSHGSPTVFIEPKSPANHFLSSLALHLPERPKAVVIASAHWETETPTFATAAHPETIHDFYGFPQEMYQQLYPAPGLPTLGNRMSELVPGLKLDPKRGLDHGAWVPSLLAWPEADLPMAQISIQPHLGPKHHFDLGRKLAPLREEGVLILASGSMTHNLRDLRRGVTGEPNIQSTLFTDWMLERLELRDESALLDYRSKAPHAQYNHPTDEHLLPLYVALGASEKGTAPNVLHHGWEHGNLAMTSLSFC